jgi:hypothetical protein
MLVLKSATRSIIKMGVVSVQINTQVNPNIRPPSEQPGPSLLLRWWPKPRWRRARIA